jgi:hypothetical protein
MTHFLLLMAVHHPKHAFLSGLKDGLLLIPRYLYNGWPGNNTRLVYRHASLFYYITFVVFVVAEVYILLFLFVRQVWRRRTVTG